METITIEMSPEVARYLYVQYAQCVEPFPFAGCTLPAPIRLPRYSSLYQRVEEYLVPQSGRLRPSHGNVTFAIPVPKGGKNPKVFNRLGARNVKKLERLVRNRMKMELYEEMSDRKVNHGTMYITSLREFLERYGIEDYVSEESLIRLFQLWKKKRREGRYRKVINTGTM